MKRLAMALVTTLVLAGLLSFSIASAGSDTGRLDRKVKVMERVLDEVLEQSPNVVVSGDNNTRGLVLDEYGALFTLEASLGTALWGPAHDVALSYFYRAQADLVEAVDEGEEDEDELFLSDEDQQKTREKCLKAFETELIETLLDYGPTLSELDGGQWVTVVAFLDQSGFFFGGKGQRLMVRAKMNDLRQYSTGKITQDQARAKFVIEREQ